jgi:hypothetical protein
MFRGKQAISTKCAKNCYAGTILRDYGNNDTNFMIYFILSLELLNMGRV